MVFVHCFMNEEKLVYESYLSFIRSIKGVES